ncbi:MAG: hypothetical protein LBB11_02075 [Puniceicoccales bacterium]|jgi:hypothetical protein|nr:hypothetical protein [Puniceicoccales bacterium]
MSIAPVDNVLRDLNELMKISANQWAKERQEDHDLLKELKNLGDNFQILVNIGVGMFIMRKFYISLSPSCQSIFIEDITNGWLTLCECGMNVKSALAVGITFGVTSSLVVFKNFPSCTSCIPTCFLL